MSWEDIAGWFIAAAAVVGIAWAPVACTTSNNEKIAEAVARGIDPIKAKCAFSSQPSSTVCAITAAKEARHD